MPGLDLIKSFTREQKYAFVALTFGYISMFCPAALIAPSLPPEAAKHNVTSSLTGIMFSTSSLMSVITGPFIGVVVAAIGPKICFIIGITLNGVFSILFGLLENIESRDGFIAGAFICMAMSALGVAIIYTSTLTYAAKMFPENMSLIIGTTETYIAIAEIIALLSGGILADIGGFQLPFIVFGGIHLLAIPLDIFLLPADNLQSEVSRRRNSSKCETAVGGKGEPLDKPVYSSTTTTSATETVNTIRPWHLLKIPRTMIMSIAVLVTGICWSFLSSTLEPHLEPLGLTATQTNLMFLLSAISYGLSSPIWGWVADKMRRSWILMTGGLIASGISFVFMGPLPIFGFENSVWHNVITLLCIACALSAAVIPACEACLAYTIEAGHKDGMATYAIVSSLIATTYSAGAAIGAFTSGFMVENIGYPLTAATFGGICSSWGILVLLYFIVFPPPKKTRVRLGKPGAGDTSVLRQIRVRNRSLSLTGSYVPPGFDFDEMNSNKATAVPENDDGDDALNEKSIMLSSFVNGEKSEHTENHPAV